LRERSPLNHVFSDSTPDTSRTVVQTDFAKSNADW
jgi:hypothetical protein